MKKAIILITVFCVSLGFLSIKSDKNNQHIFKISITNLINQAYAECEEPYNQSVWNVVKHCSDPVPSISCIDGGSETCCLTDHC